MLIILDANIYASDYRMTGLSFQALFDYMRKTESRLVMPRIIREEVILDYGRRLKSESKRMAEVWNRYRHLKLDNTSKFALPDIKAERNALRRMMRNPSDGVKPVYVHETTGVSIDEVFMRGAMRIRPARDDGEELRDVVIWLWSLAYSKTANADTAFITQDSGFWDGESIHPHIAKDLGTNPLMHIYHSIDDFIKEHSPAPARATEEWVKEFFSIDRVKQPLLDRAEAQLRFGGVVQNITLEKHELAQGNVYDVGPDTQFAELNFRLWFRLSYFEPERPATLTLSALSGVRADPVPFQYLGNVNQILASNVNSMFARPIDVPEEKLVFRDIQFTASALISVRVKKAEPVETSVDKVEVDQRSVWSSMYGTPA